MMMWLWDIYFKKMCCRGKDLYKGILFIRIKLDVLYRLIRNGERKSNENKRSCKK